MRRKDKPAMPSKKRLRYRKRRHFEVFQPNGYEGPLACPNCYITFSIGFKYKGELVRCPNCGLHYVIEGLNPCYIERVFPDGIEGNNWLLKMAIRLYLGHTMNREERMEYLFRSIALAWR